jgi:hypothetical protein
MNAATEADDTSPMLKNQVTQSFREWISKISSVISQGQQNSELSADANAEEYAALFIMLIEGGILLSKTTGEEKFLNQALDRALHIIDNELNIHPS